MHEVLWAEEGWMDTGQEPRVMPGRGADLEGVGEVEFGTKKGKER